MSISLLILTLNEEINIGPCLDRLTWSDDVVVLDSFSKDRTVEIAHRYPNVRVVQRKFDNWAAHQNWAMEQIPFRHPWVFYLDADERMTDELRDEIAAIAGNASEPRVAFYCGRKNYFMDRWIRHAMPPGNIMRFFRPEKVRFERLVNPVPVIDGPHGYLAGMFLHYNFSKGMTEWFDKHNKYSQLEALEGVKLRRGEAGTLGAAVRAMWSMDPALRRKAVKNISFFMPGRALLRFLHAYFLKRGFLDGLAGFYYAVLISMYESWITIKMRECDSDWTRRDRQTVERLLREDQP